MFTQSTEPFVPSKAHIEAPMVQAYVPCKVPPWLHRKRNCRLYVASKSKKLCHPAELKLLFRSVLVEYVEESTTEYNDGLKTESRVSNALVIDGAFYSWTLTKRTSVYTAKLYAIYRKFVICTVSQNFVTALVIRAQWLHYYIR